MKPVELKSRTYIDSSKEVNDKDSKFKVEDIVRISKYKNVFAKGYISNWSGEDFIIKKLKSTVPLIYFISALKGEEIVGTFYEKELQKNKSKKV